jgi:hypothetical protein
MMKFFLLFITLNFMLSGFLSGQNLVPDPGFETIKNLQNEGAWYSANTGSPDLIGEGKMAYGSAFACKGRKSAGIILYDEDNPQYREYLACRLQKALIKDSCYVLTFWVQASASSYYLTDGFGVWLGTEFKGATDNSLLPLIPVWKQSRMEIVAESKGWKQLTIRLKASGGEQVLIMGNFNNDEQTLLRVNNRKSLFRLAYLQLDEVNLTACHKTVAVVKPDLNQTHSRKGNLFIPNMVTPNDDGFNDDFFIPELPAYTGIIIRNAADQEIFREKYYQNNWNGNGLPAGKYHYELLLPDGNMIYGSFDLVKKRPVKQKPSGTKN